MATPTDKVLFALKKPKKVGRPKADYEGIWAMSQLKKADGSRQYSTHYICQQFGVSSRLFRKVIDWGEKQKELIPQTADDLKRKEDQNADFNELTKSAMNTKEGLLEFVIRKSPTAGQSMYNFIEQSWKVLGCPSVSEIADRSKSTGANFITDWLAFFDKPNDPEYIKRIRGRKKHFRQLFRFLGRSDLNDKFLTMSRSHDPEQIRIVPEMEFPDFPLKLEKVITRIRELLGVEGELIIKLKIISQMRTGKESAGRELWGIHKGHNTSWIQMKSPNEITSSIKAKGGVYRQLNWIPSDVRKLLWEIYQKRDDEEPLIQLDVTEFRKLFKQTCVEMGLPPMILHDLRKVSVTWLYVMNIRLEKAIKINVGWDDMNTMEKHYLQYENSLIMKDKRLIYKANIPAWFKEGLDQFADPEAGELMNLVNDLKAKLAKYEKVD